MLLLLQLFTVSALSPSMIDEPLQAKWEVNAFSRDLIWNVRNRIQTKHRNTAYWLEFDVIQPVLCTLSRMTKFTSLIYLDIIVSFIKLIYPYLLYLKIISTRRTFDGFLYEI